MKYEVYNTYNDCIVCIADTLNDARIIASIVDAQCQESDEWIPWCVIREIPEFYNPMHLHQVQNTDAFASILKQPNEKESRK